MKAQPNHRTENDPKRSIIQAIHELDLTQTDSWDDLDALSNQTHIDSIEIDPEGIIFDSDQKFNGIFNVYVSLNYGSEPDTSTTSEAFIGRFKGHFDSRKQPIFDKIEVDTSPFYD